MEREHSVVTVNVLAVERRNKRKNVSDFDRIQIVVARLLDSVGLVGSFASAAVKHKPEGGQRRGDFKQDWLRLIPDLPLLGRKCWLYLVAQGGF